nr:glycosyltransferase [Bifidobacterium choloepi]
MSVYAGNDIAQFERAVQSGTIEQTLPPDQVVIVRDGPVSIDVQRFLDTLQQTIDVWFSIADPAVSAPKVTVVTLERNDGLAHALNEGLKHCDYDIVARADADDISLPERFAKTIVHFADRPSAGSHRRKDATGRVDVLGSAIQEFTEIDTRHRAADGKNSNDPHDSAGNAPADGSSNAPARPHERRTLDNDYGRRKLGQVRLLPAEGEELRRYARMQSPVHHPSVVFRKSAVLAAGGYPEDAGRFEDYLLWARMMVGGAVFMNVPEPLVLYRADDGAFERRGGGQMFRDEWRLQRQFRREGFTTAWQFWRNVGTRAVYRLVPTSVREKAYHLLVARRNQGVQKQRKH